MRNKFLSKAEIFVFASLACFMALYAAQRLQGLEPASFESLASGRDDWNRYARHAVDIHSNGLLMPEISCPYGGPGGFLYNYFLSFFLLIGIHNVDWVYIVQVVMLFAAALLLYLAWRRFSEEVWYRSLLLVFVSVGVVVDMLPYYAFRLLSENLALPLQALFLFSLERAFTPNRPFKPFFWLISGLSLGSLVLTRPNIVLFVPFFAIISFYFILKNYNKKSKLLLSVFFCIIIPVFLCSLIAIRNLTLCDSTEFIPTEGLAHAVDKDTIKNAFSMPKMLFIMGWLKALVSTYAVRPHWLLGWLIFLFVLSGWVLMSIKRKEWLIITDSLGVKLIFMIYYFVIMFFVDLTSYGYRFIVPLYPLMWGTTGSLLCRIQCLRKT